MGSEASACVVNIGPVGSRRRLLGGLAGIATGLVLVGLAAGSDAPGIWRLAAFVPLLGGALGCFQARAKT